MIQNPMRTPIMTNLTVETNQLMVETTHFQTSNDTEETQDINESNSTQDEEDFIGMLKVCSLTS